MKYNVFVPITQCVLRLPVLNDVFFTFFNHQCNVNLVLRPSFYVSDSRLMAVLVFMTTFYVYRYFHVLF